MPENGTQIDGSSAQRESTWIIAHLTGKSRRTARKTLSSPHLECHPCKDGSSHPDQYLGSMQVDEDGCRFASSDSCHHDQCRTRKLNGSSAQRESTWIIAHLTGKSRRIARETLFSPHLECHPCKDGSSHPDQYLGSMQVDEDGKRFAHLEAATMINAGEWRR